MDARFFFLLFELKNVNKMQEEPKVLMQRVCGVGSFLSCVVFLQVNLDFRRYSVSGSVEGRERGCVCSGL
jgi:hypothetical protein